MKWCILVTLLRWWFMSLYNEQLLVRAAKCGDTQTVRSLLDTADPSWSCSLALMRAAENGHVECVKLLIPVSNPRDHSSRALMMAVARGEDACVEALLEHSDCSKVLTILRNEKFPFTPTYQAFEAHVVRGLLCEQIVWNTSTKKRAL